jgi:hypothetical protein
MPPKSIAPIRELPIGSASLSQSAAGLSYQMDFSGCGAAALAATRVTAAVADKSDCFIMIVDEAAIHGGRF